MPENNNWYSLKSEYERFKVMFTKKYGKPDSYEYFTEPYEEGDGYEHTALSVGKCSYISFFTLPLGTISLRISESLLDKIKYIAEENKRSANKEIEYILEQYGKYLIKNKMLLVLLEQVEDMIKLLLTLFED